MKIALKIAYDGFCFAGFQRQSKACSVQGSLEEALSKILSSTINIVGAGRTDAGVHASGQVVCFDCPKEIAIAGLTYSLNCILPPSIRILETVLLEPNDPFQPRYSAISRTYSYYILENSTPMEGLFFGKQAWCLAEKLDLSLANEACQKLKGELDFSSFCYQVPPEKSRVRRVLDFSIASHPGLAPINRQGEANLLRLTIRANGFLRRMVRLLTTAVVQVGLGRLSLSQLSDLLEAVNPLLAPHPAPAQGLYLEGVHYEPDPFKRAAGGPNHYKAAMAPSKLLKTSVQKKHQE